MKKPKFDMDVPIPHAKGKDKYGLSDFPLNASKFIPVSKDTVRYLRNNIREQATKKNPGAKFTVRFAVENGKKGYRIWRIE